MNDFPFFEEHLQKVAHDLKYPATPPISGVIRHRLGRPTRARLELRFRLALLALVVLLSLALAVPGVRAQILEFLQLGAVRIFPSQPTIPVTPGSELKTPVTATPYQPGTPPDRPKYSLSLDDLAGETTLKSARSKAVFEISLPSLPGNLGDPDRVFVQLDGQLVLLVWMDSDDPQHVRMSLHEMTSSNVLFRKYEPGILKHVRVNGHPALWAEGPYLVEITGGDLRLQRLVEGNTLIWEEDGITYRLESGLPLEDAKAIAESLE